MAVDIIQAMGEVNQYSPRAFGEGKFIDAKLSRRGELTVIDFYTEMMLEGRGYQVRAGTVTTPLVGDVDLTDSAAEFCVDAPQGTLVLPVYLNIAVRLGTGTLHEYALKTVDTASTGGAVFVPLLLLGDTDGPSSASNGGATARVAAAGGVAVTAEAATTTRRPWSASNPVAVAAGHELTTHQYQPRTPHTIANNACCYCQIAAATTGPSYFASLDFLQLLWTAVS